MGKDYCNICGYVGCIVEGKMERKPGWRFFGDLWVCPECSDSKAYSSIRAEKEKIDSAIKEVFEKMSN